MTATLDVAVDIAATPAVPSGVAACPDDCCVVTVDLTLDPDLEAWGSVGCVRPMFQVLYDDADWPGENVHPFSEDDPNGMRIPVDEYDRHDRIWL